MSFEEHVLQDLCTCPLQPATCATGRDFVILTRDLFQHELDRLRGHATFFFLDDVTYIEWEQ